MSGRLKGESIVAEQRPRKPGPIYGWRLSGAIPKLILGAPDPIEPTRCGGHIARPSSHWPLRTDKSAALLPIGVGETLFELDPITAVRHGTPAQLDLRASAAPG